MEVQAQGNRWEINSPSTQWLCHDPISGHCDVTVCNNECKQQYKKPGECHPRTPGTPPVCCCILVPN